MDGLVSLSVSAAAKTVEKDQPANSENAAAAAGEQVAVSKFHKDPAPTTLAMTADRSSSREKAMRLPIQKVTKAGKVVGQKITQTVAKIKQLGPPNNANKIHPEKQQHQQMQKHQQRQQQLNDDEPTCLADQSDTSDGVEREMDATGDHMHVILPHFRNSPADRPRTSDKTTMETPVHSNSKQNQSTEVVVGDNDLPVASRKSPTSENATPPSWIQHLWWISIAAAIQPTYRFCKQNDFALSSLLLCQWLWVAYLTGQVLSISSIVRFLQTRLLHNSNPQDAINSFVTCNQMPSTKEMNASAVTESDCADNNATGDERAAESNCAVSKNNHTTKSRKPNKAMAWINKHTPISINTQSPPQTEKPLWSSLNPKGSTNNNTNDKGSAPPKWLRRLDPKDFGRLIHKHRNNNNSNNCNEEPENDCGTHIDSPPSIEESPSFETQNTIDTSMGVVKDLDKNVKSFDHEATWVTHPILGVRGMDVFLSDDPPEEVGNNAWLIQQGLRTVPTLLLNGLTQWGNILVYFELPEWVTDFDKALEICPNDTASVRALKDFLRETDDYRNDRFKFIPAVVEGPMAVKILAPPKRERIIHGQVISLEWKKYDKQIDPTTQETLQPLLSVTVDCVSNPSIRKMSNIVKKYLASLTLDLALVIGAPPESDCGSDEENKACLGLFRFEKVDVASCPNFPEATEVSMQPTNGEGGCWSSDMEADLLRASVLCGMSAHELKEFCDEHKTRTDDVMMSELTV